jgi:hypothetical protein
VQILEAKSDVIKLYKIFRMKCWGHVRNALKGSELCWEICSGIGLNSRCLPRVRLSRSAWDQLPNDAHHRRVRHSDGSILAITLLAVQKPALIRHVEGERGWLTHLKEFLNLMFTENSHYFNCNRPFTDLAFPNVAKGSASNRLSRMCNTVQNQTFRKASIFPRHSKHCFVD